MFVQVIQGQVADPAAFEERSRTWNQQLRPGASGYVGSTGGVAEDGTAIIMACFSDEESAMANSGRPEQDSWWRETKSLFTSSPTFRNTTDVQVWGGGLSPQAGFVQVMEGRTPDRRRYDELWAQGEQEMEQMRPDVLGGITAWFDGDQYVECVYFTSEAEAREGERAMGTQEMPPEAKELMDLSGDVTFYDLRSPLITSSG